MIPKEAIAQMSMGEYMYWRGADWWYIKTIPWFDAYWDDYREALPVQWRAPVEESTPPMLLEANADEGDVILYEAHLLREQSERIFPQYGVNPDLNQWGR